MGVVDIHLLFDTFSFKCTQVLRPMFPLDMIISYIAFRVELQLSHNETECIQQVHLACDLISRGQSSSTSRGLAFALSLPRKSPPSIECGRTTTDTASSSRIFWASDDMEMQHISTAEDSYSVVTLTPYLTALLRFI